MLGAAPVCGLAARSSISEQFLVWGRSARGSAAPALQVEEVKALLPNILGSLEETDGRVVSEGVTAIQNLLKFMQRNDIVGLAEKLLPLFSNVSLGTAGAGVRSAPTPGPSAATPPVTLLPCF